MATKRNPKRTPKVRGTDWPWVWHCVGRVLLMSVLSIVVSIVVVWLFYHYGWVWHVRHWELILTLSLVVFLPTYIPLWRLFTFCRRTDGQSSPTWALRFVSGFNIAVGIMAVVEYADPHFAPLLDVPQITRSTSLDNIGRVHVQQLRVDGKRGVGVAFTTSRESSRYSSSTRFHCYVVVPIADRIADYYGMHINEKHHNSESDARMQRHWNEFVERCQRIIQYASTGDVKRLKRVQLDFDVDNYTTALHNGFGRKSPHPFTVWEADDSYSLTIYLLGGGFFMMVYAGLVVLIMYSKDVRREDMA